MSESPESGEAGEWHEHHSVTITRLVCQFALSIGTLLVALFLLLTHPEYVGGIALVSGIVLGAWFGVVREPIWRTKR